MSSSIEPLLNTTNNFVESQNESSIPEQDPATITSIFKNVMLIDAQYPTAYTHHPDYPGKYSWKWVLAASAVVSAFFVPPVAATLGLGFVAWGIGSVITTGVCIATKVQHDCCPSLSREKQD